MRESTRLANSKRAIAVSRDVSSWDQIDRRILESCHPKQRGFVIDPGRRVAALVARGGGKTTGARARLVRRLVRTPKASTLFAATTRGAAEELMWGPLKDLLEGLGVEAKFNESKLRCTLLKNNSKLRLVGLDDKREIEKLRGIPFHEVGIDEGASHDAVLLQHLLFRILGPRMGDYENSAIFMIGTPGHVQSGPFFDATRSGSTIHRPWGDRDLPEYKLTEHGGKYLGWSFHAWNLSDGAKTIPAMRRLWAAAKIEKEANDWGEDNPVWRREYLGRWCADDTTTVFRYQAFDDKGEPFNQWSPDKSKTGLAKLPYEADWEFVYGADMGHADPFSLEVFAWDPADSKKRLFHVYEHCNPGMYSKKIAELLLGEGLDAENPSGLIGETGWPSGCVADIAGLGGAMLDELANVYGVRFKPSEKKNKFDSIEMFNGDLLDGKILIMKGSKLEEQLLELQWSVDDYGRLKEHKGLRNDCTDAAIYARREACHLLGEDAAVPEPFFKPRHEIGEEPSESAGEFDSILSDGSYGGEFWG